MQNPLWLPTKFNVELAWCSGCVMDCHATTWGSIPGGNGVKTEFHVLHKGQKMGVLSLNVLNVDEMFNTTNQPTKIVPVTYMMFMQDFKISCPVSVEDIFLVKLTIVQTSLLQHQTDRDVPSPSQIRLRLP